MQELTTQVTQKLASSNNVLILLPPKTDGDAVGAALALRAFLKKLEKEVTVLTVNGDLDSRFRFLPEFEHIQTSLQIVKNFVIDVSTRRVGIEELSYKKEPEKLSVFLKPKIGQLEPSDVTFRQSNFPFDFIVCLNIVSLDQLGEFYASNAELFFETPVINIDHAADNENYGQLNLVKLNASSVSEIVFDLINEYESSLIDQVMATQLLTGIISKTNSFQHARTTPAAMTKASQLVSIGGNQQEIIKQLYKTKSLGLLKLWGRVLARLKLASESNLALSAINQSDVVKANASLDDVENIIKEMISQLGVAKIFAFLVETGVNQVACYLASLPPIEISPMFSMYQPQPARAGIKFTMSGSLSFAESEILRIISMQTEKI